MNFDDTSAERLKRLKQIDDILAEHWKQIKKKPRFDLKEMLSIQLQEIQIMQIDDILAEHWKQIKAKCARRHNEAVLRDLEVGDMVEFPRGHYSHWGVYIGVEQIIHLSFDCINDYNLTNSFTTWDKYFGKATVKIDDFFYVCGESLAKKNNSKDAKFGKPTDIREVVGRAMSKLEAKGYNCEDCEHFASFCRYGKEYSKQSHLDINNTSYHTFEKEKSFSMLDSHVNIIINAEDCNYKIKIKAVVGLSVFIISLSLSRFLLFPLKRIHTNTYENNVIDIKNFTKKQNDHQRKNLTEEIGNGIVDNKTKANNKDVKNNDEHDIETMQKSNVKVCMSLNEKPPTENLQDIGLIMKNLLSVGTEKEMEVSLSEENLFDQSKKFEVSDKKDSPLACIVNLRQHQPITQNSVWIVSYMNAEMQDEFKRLYSFKDWPYECLVSATQLVAAGFYCTDTIRKEVTCSACGFKYIVANRISPMTVHKEKSPNCDFVRSYGMGLNRVGGGLLHTRENQLVREGHAATIVQAGQVYQPKNVDFEDPQERRNTFRFWPKEQPFQDIELLISCGFFYTGQKDIVRCFYCDIGLAEWNKDEDPHVEHARHSRDCLFLLNQKGEEFVQKIQNEWKSYYKPKHQNLANIEQRLDTFSSGWPANMVSQDPRIFAEAGFFFTGEGDTVKCFYCGGGLLEWEDEDDPWAEHARWFPFCKFVQKNKSAEYIQNCQKNRSSTRNEDSSSFAKSSTTKTTTVSAEEKFHRLELKNPLYSAAAQSLKDQGYDKRVVAAAINIYIAKEGKRNFKATDLLEIIFDKYDDVEANENEDWDVDSDDEFVITKEALIKENEYLTQKNQCVGCKKNERVMLNVPCHHRIFCEDCSNKRKICFACNAPVDNYVKTFLG